METGEIFTNRDVIFHEDACPFVNDKTKEVLENWILIWDRHQMVLMMNFVQQGLSERMNHNSLPLTKLNKMMIKSRKLPESLDKKLGNVEPMNTRN